MNYDHGVITVLLSISWFFLLVGVYEKIEEIVNIEHLIIEPKNDDIPHYWSD